MTRVTITGIALLVLAGGAFAAGPQTDAPKEPKDTRCLFADRVDGFKDPKKESVILTDGSRDYLVTFVASCRGLNWAQEIATVARGGACLTPGDKVVFKETPGFTERCYIKSIEMIEKPDRTKTPS